MNNGIINVPGFGPVDLAVFRPGFGAGVALRHRYRIECFDARGRLKWFDQVDNLLVDEGLNDILDKYWKGSAYSAAHYLGLCDGTPTVAAGDTLASHAGWVEVTAYTGDRKSLVLGSVASKSVDNSASKASFAINADSTTIGGAFIGTVATGTSGVLVGAGAFTGGDKGADNGDTVNVTTTLTAASA